MGWNFDIGSREDVTRRRVLGGMLASAAGVVAAGCTPWTAQGRGRGSGTVLPPETRPYPALPEGVDTLPQIEHVVIYMQENQSFDHYFGTLRGVDGFTFGPDGMPTNSNPDASGNAVTVSHHEATCDGISGDHGWNGTHRSINGGAMDGFAQVSGPRVMGYFDGTNLPFYRGLAHTFPICDRWFSSVPGPTHPNRRYLLAGTSAGLITTDPNAVAQYPSAPNGTIFERLDDFGITWKDYAIDLWDVLLYPSDNVLQFAIEQGPHLTYFGEFLYDCAHGTLPQVSIIAPGVQDQYDEGSADVQNGEIYSAAIINAVMSGPKWGSTAVFFTYDEHGGGYDHVPPPPAVAPDAIAPRLQPGDEPGSFAEYGVRVPGFVVSPWARPGGADAGAVAGTDHAAYVSHVTHDHTSILRFVETKFNLGALTYRDANADNLFDCFDFGRPAFLEPPTLPAPGLPATGSACDPQPRPPTLPSA
jgi:phospholipase C